MVECALDVIGRGGASDLGLMGVESIVTEYWS